jgi:hypothetical protein
MLQPARCGNREVRRDRNVLRARRRRALFGANHERGDAAECNIRHDLNRFVIYSNQIHDSFGTLHWRENCIFDVQAPGSVVTASV